VEPRRHPAIHVGLAVLLLTMITKQRKRLLALGAVLVLAGVGTGAAIASEESAGPDLSAPSPTGTASSIPAELIAAYSSLANSRGTTDALPQEAIDALDEPGSFGTHYGVNVALSHLMGFAGGRSVWLVPGASGSCVWVSTGGAICGSNALIIERGAFQELVPTETSVPLTAIGIVPDGATVSDGREGYNPVPGAIVNQVGDVFFVSGRPAANTFTIVLRSGAKYTYDL